jgi:transposase
LSSIIVGIDIAKYDHKARIFDDRGRELTSKAISFTNSAEGFDVLISNINKICLANSKDHVLIGVEPTGHYWFNILHYIDNLETIIKYEMVTVNPYHTKRANELDDNSQTKNDTKVLFGELFYP